MWVVGVFLFVMMSILFGFVGMSMEIIAFEFCSDIFVVVIN